MSARVLRHGAAFLLWALAGPSAGADEATLAAKWRSLFARTPTEMPDVEAVLAASGGSVEALEKLFASDSAYRRYEPGWHRRTTAVVHEGDRCEVEYLFRVPRGYDPGRPHPLLLVAHGQGGSGKTAGAMMQRGLGPQAEKYVILAPTLPGGQRYAGTSGQEQACLKPLEWVRLNLNVDDDRIYVAGYSMGGHCAWHLATMYPRLLAAAVPMAGVPVFEGSPYTGTSYLENLSHLPVWAIWGERDRKAPGTMSNVDFSRLAAKRLEQLGNRHFKGTEVPGGGHEACWPGRAAFVGFLAAHRRQAAPATFTHCFHSRRHRRGYYVEAVRFTRDEVDFSRPVRPQVRFRPGESGAEAVLRTGRQLYEKSLFKIEAELDRAGNALSIRTSGVSAVRVYVTAGAFDLTRPATLRFAGKAWTCPIPASARCMLTHYAGTRDASAVVYNEVELDSAGKLTVRFAPPAAKTGG